MTLADAIAADLPTFVNVTEFGRSRVVDGTAVNCDLQDVEKRIGAAGQDGVYLLESVLRLRTAALVAVPVVSQRMIIDGRPANVVNVNDELGLVTIKLEWCES